MFRRFSVNFALFAIGMDALLIIAALALASAVRPGLSGLPFIQEVPAPWSVPWPLYLLFPVLWTGILLLVSVYDGRHTMRANDELASLSIGSAVALVSMAGTLYLSFRDVSRALFLLFFILAFLAMVIWRMAARWLLHKNSSWKRPQRRVLIVGAGSVGRQLQSQIQEFPELDLAVIGFLDDNEEKLHSQSDILGRVTQARRVIRQQNVEDVVIALPGSAFELINKLVAELHDLPVKVWVVPDYFRLALHQAKVEDFAGIPMLDLRAPALSDYQRLVKRAFDLVVTLLAFPPILMLTAIIALFIRLEGDGPIIFRQKRVGENGRLFELYKFRTMVPGAEKLRAAVERRDENGYLIHKTPTDPRITRVGRFLRSTSLDELPQFFNILKGDMSLVGPRPELPYLVDEYKPWQRRRFAVPPGLTGWWQVNGRSDKPMHLNTEDDLYYVQHYSLWLDLWILFRTVWVVVNRKGAF
jgi:exopolysaccharide biosynthesis polyprenyl glycosylphosphotransferase